MKEEIFIFFNVGTTNKQKTLTFHLFQIFRYRRELSSSTGEKGKKIFS